MLLNICFKTDLLFYKITVERSQIFYEQTSIKLNYCSNFLIIYQTQTRVMIEGYEDSVIFSKKFRVKKY